jgi:hypothetical protein
MKLNYENNDKDKEKNKIKMVNLLELVKLNIESKINHTKSLHQNI